MKSDPLHPTSVAIIGAGFSGTLVLANLINILPPNSGAAVTWIEKTAVFGCGIAYSTKNPYHLLNVRADQMGAWAHAPNHFYLWLMSNVDKWQALFPNLHVNPDSFVPRQLYAMYLAALVEETRQEASKKNISLTFIAAEVTSVSLKKDGFQLTLKKGNDVMTQSIVLATNFPIQQAFSIDPHLPTEAYIQNIWQPPVNSILSQSNLAHLPSNTLVAIVGTGLTMVDAAVGLIKMGYPGKIIAFSKHGSLPEPHLKNRLQTPLSFGLQNLPSKLLAIFKYIRKEILSKQNQGIDWRAVIDALRPITEPLWKKLTLKDKKQFIRHLSSRWNRCRHRIPPESALILDDFLNRRKLQLLRGEVIEIKEAQNKQVIVVANNREIEVDCVLNCSGPQMNVHRTTNPLLRQLLRDGFIESDPLHLGICVNKNYQVQSKKDLPIFAMGQLLTGQLLETVAVPELREQCAHIANEIYSRIIKTAPMLRPNT